ncbi:MAG: hypothetical protein ABGY72_07335 [bacterium]
MVGRREAPVERARGSGAIERRTHPTATAHASLGHRDFRSERRPAVRGPCHPDASPFLSTFTRVGVPEHRDTVARIRGHCAAAIEPEGMGHEVALRLKLAVVVETRVQHRALAV